MLAVAISEPRAAALIDEVAKTFGKVGLWIACVNSKTNITISGDRDQIEALELLLDEIGQPKQRLKISVAYHSPHMVPATEFYRESITNIDTPEETISCPPIMLSSVTGQVVSPETLKSSDYWIQNLVSAVRFGDAVSPICVGSRNEPRASLDRSHRRTMLVDFLIEVGPHSALRGPVRELLEECSNQGRTTYLSAMTRGVSAAETLLSVAGQLHCSGYTINFTAINNPDKSMEGIQILTELPEYPFDHAKSYWLESRLSKNFRFAAHTNNVFLGKPVSDWNPLDARWRNFISISAFPWVMDHKVWFVTSIDQ